HVGTAGRDFNCLLDTALDLPDSFTQSPARRGDATPLDAADEGKQLQRARVPLDMVAADAQRHRSAVSTGELACARLVQEPQALLRQLGLSTASLLVLQERARRLGSRKDPPSIKSRAL